MKLRLCNKNRQKQNYCIKKEDWYTIVGEGMDESQKVWSDVPYGAETWIMEFVRQIIEKFLSVQVYMEENTV